MVKFRHTPFSIDQYEFQVGGDGDSLLVDFVNDKSQGLMVPARSLLIENHAGGAGNNYVWFKTSEDGSHWSRTSRINPDAWEEFEVRDECIFCQLIVWASNANCRVSVRATPGQWTQQQYDEILPSIMLARANFDWDSMNSELI